MIKFDRMLTCLLLIGLAGLCSADASFNMTSDACTTKLNSMSASELGDLLGELLRNPPKNWTLGCMTEKLAEQFLKNRTHIEMTIECLEASNIYFDYEYQCDPPGIQIIAGGFSLLPHFPLYDQCKTNRTAGSVRYFPVRNLLVIVVFNLRNCIKR